MMRTRGMRWGSAATAALWSGVLCGLAPALASAQSADPHRWQLNMGKGVTQSSQVAYESHMIVLLICVAIGVLVFGAMAFAMFRFRKSKGAVAAQFSHNTTAEIIWTVVPILILIVIAVPSFKLLYFGDKTKDAELTIKAIGKQWYWSYEYPDNGNFTFDATMTAEADLKPGQPRLLETDNPVVVPVNTNVRLLVTAADVIHAWAMPAFGVKKDAVPGRLNETWFRAEREGTYYGQCSEICGANHAFMPIKVQVVSKEAYARWAEEAKQKFATVDGPSPRLADARAAQ